MPDRPCPRCRKTGRFLVDSSASATVDYFRCDGCGEVWVLDRTDASKPPRSVTLPKRDSDDRPAASEPFTE